MNWTAPQAKYGFCIGLVLSLGSSVEMFFAGKGYHCVVITLYNRLLSLEQVGEHNRFGQSIFKGCQTPWVAKLGFSSLLFVPVEGGVQYKHRGMLAL